MSKSYYVIVNMPGYMPDIDPIECDTFDQAQAVLKEEIQNTVESLDPDEKHVTEAQLEAIKQDVTNADEGEHTWQVMGLAHSIAYA